MSMIGTLQNDTDVLKSKKDKIHTEHYQRGKAFENIFDVYFISLYHLAKISQKQQRFLCDVLQLWKLICLKEFCRMQQLVIF